MRNVRQVLRLAWEANMSQEEVGRACGLSKGAVNKYLQRAVAAGLAWPLPSSLDDAALEGLLRAKSTVPAPKFPTPDFPTLTIELRRKGMTKWLLWEEYRLAHGTPSYSYAQFCHLLRAWRKKQASSLRQEHKAGEKAFSDFSGQRMPVVDARTGEVRDAEIFVEVLGASTYTFACAVWTQGLQDWLGCQRKALEFFGGVPAMLVPDNLKAAVSRAERYEPGLNPAFEEFAVHYGTTILPTRPYKPKDKAKVENAVLIVQRWILARLRHRTFFSLAELNEAIAGLLKDLNNRPFKKLPGCRASLFAQLDKPALRALPAKPFDYGRWIKVRVHIDYHVEIDGHYYSVPYSLAHEQLDARLSQGTVELFKSEKRVASHPRSFRKGGKSTVADHMPMAHRKHLEWTPGRLLNWGLSVGPRTCEVVRHILESRKHPEHGYRSCLGLLHLSRTCGKERLEAACGRAVSLRSPSYPTVKSILEQHMENQPMPGAMQVDLLELPQHHNIRGPHYYH
jgi:transposase